MVHVTIVPKLFIASNKLFENHMSRLLGLTEKIEMVTDLTFIIFCVLAMRCVELEEV